MYLHIGGDLVVPLRDVVGVFKAEGSHGEAKSFVVLRDNTVFLSSIGVVTLRKRWLRGGLQNDEMKK